MTGEGQAMIIRSFMLWHSEEITDDELIRWYGFLKDLEAGKDEALQVPKELEHIIEKMAAQSAGGIKH